MSNALDYLRNEMAKSMAETPQAEPQPVVETPVQETPIETPEATEVAPQETQEPQTPIVPEETQPTETVAEINTEPSVPKETPSTQYANEEVAMLNAYLQKNPDKTLRDYQNLTRPASELSEDELLKKYLSEKEGMTEKEIQLEMRKLEVKASEEGDFDFEDSDDESRLEAEAKRERRLRESQQWYEQSQEELLNGLKTEATPPESQTNEPVEALRQQILDEGRQRQEATKNEYYVKTYQALNEIGDFNLPIMGDDVKFSPDESFRKALREGLDIEKSLGKFYDDKGQLSDPAGFVKEVAYWHQPTRQAMIDFATSQAYERGKADALKNRKNITLDSRVPITGNNVDDGTKDAVDAYLKGSYKRM